MRNLGFVISNFTKLSLVLFIIIFTVLSSSCCEAASTPSSCGKIQNISCPFKLKGDHQKCNVSFFIQELSCLNNRTILYSVTDKQFFVESINYDNLSIRIVHPGIPKYNSSSPLLHSITEEDLITGLDYYSPIFWDLADLNQRITVIECPSPLISTTYINIASPNSSSSSIVLGKYIVYSYTYIVPGGMDVSEMENNCRISKSAWVSLQSPYSDVLSNVSEIYDAMAYGLDLPWTYFYCLNCERARAGTGYCSSFSLEHHDHWTCERQPKCDLLH